MGLVLTGGTKILKMLPSTCQNKKINISYINTISITLMLIYGCIHQVFPLDLVFCLLVFGYVA